MSASIKVYGADWCSMTIMTLSHLRQLGVPHEYIDIEKDSNGAAFVRSHNAGKEKKPTLDIAGTILVEPSNFELDKVLRSQHIIS